MGISALFTTLYKQGWVDDTMKFVVPKYDATTGKNSKRNNAYNLTKFF